MKRQFLLFLFDFRKFIGYNIVQYHFSLLFKSGGQLNQAVQFSRSLPGVYRFFCQLYSFSERGCFVSRLQCRSGVGHFAGGLRGPEIASPGPGKDIVDCALNMVRIWRGSPPHYGVMVRYHREFGYDMAANSRTHYYGTGRF